MTNLPLIVVLAFYLVFIIIQAVGGNLDAWRAKPGQRRRRRRYQKQPAHPDPIQAALEEHVAVMTPNAGLAVVIITPAGTRQWYIGHIDGDLSKTPDADTPFEIGSITKTFTASLLVAMEREGQVSLDTPLDDLLPPNDHMSKKQPIAVTLNSLATHTSGLPRLPWGLPMVIGMYLKPQQPYTLISHGVLKRWLRHRRTHFGQRYRHSNLGYGILGNVLAEHAGSTYAEVLERYVLRPLGLDHTRVGQAMDAAHKVAQPHTACGRRVPAWNLRALRAAGALHSTLDDMTRWLQVNLAVTAPLDARLHEARANSGGKNRSVALGWHVDGAYEQRVIWHNGGTGGSRSFMAFAPARGSGIVVLSNSAVGVDQLSLRLLRQVNHDGGHAALPEHMQNMPAKQPGPDYS